MKAALSIIIIQPGFMSMAYSGAAEKDVEFEGIDGVNGNASIVAKLNGIPYLLRIS